MSRALTDALREGRIGPLSEHETIGPEGAIEDSREVLLSRALHELRRHDDDASVALDDALSTCAQLAWPPMRITLDAQATAEQVAARNALAEWARAYLGGAS